MKPCADCRRALTRERYCETCKPKHSKWSGKSATERGYGYEWQKLRNAVMAEQGYHCQECKKSGVISRAREVDHIIPKSQGGTDDVDNLAALCIACHSAKSQRESGGARAYVLPKRMPRPRKPLYVVCGPPGAGKSTYVAQNADKHDMVLDLDALAEEIHKRPLHELDRATRNALLEERNDRLIRFAEGNTIHRRCWLIATAGTQLQRDFWESKGAKVVVIHPGADVCIARIVEETRRPAHVKARLARAIESWA